MDQLFMKGDAQSEGARWLRQAAEDLKSAEVASDVGLYNWSCFMCQQSGEKALTAFLYAKGAEDVWGHALADLCEDTINFDPTFTMLKSVAVLLDKYYYVTRYPSQLPGGISSDVFDRIEADRAIEIATEVMHGFAEKYKKNWFEMMRKKLGLLGEDSKDENLIIDLLSWMHQNKADYTNTFCFLMNENIQENKIYNNQGFISWKQQWKERLKLHNNSPEESLKLMRSTNPLVIPRNHKVEEALNSASTNNDLMEINNLLKVLKNPYKNSPEIANYQSSPPPSNKIYKTFCGT